jgi:hypothetical protein
MMKKMIKIISLFLFLGVTTVSFAEEEVALQAINTSDIRTYEGHPLSTLVERMPAELVDPFMLKLKIKGLANGIAGFQGASDDSLKKFTLSYVVPVGQDAGEEDLLQQQNGAVEYKQLLEKQACVLELFPATLNFSQSVVTWETYVICIEPDKKSTSDTEALQAVSPFTA